MSRELDINISVNDGEAKQKLAELDAAADKTASSFSARLGPAVSDYEQRVQKAAASSKLTTEELGRLRAQLASGIDPRGIDQATNSLTQMDRIATRLVERMAILFAIRGVAQFTEGLFSGARALDDLSQTTEFSTTKLQEFQYVEIQTGVKMASLTQAADALNRHLVKGDDSTVEALDRLGLSWDYVFRLAPEERFDLISKSIAGMGDRTERAGVEIQLFGTDKIDPAIIRLQALEKSAHDAGVVMGEDTVKQLADADRAYEVFWMRVKVIGAEFLVAAQNAATFWAMASGTAGPQASGAAGQGAVQGIKDFFGIGASDFNRKFLDQSLRNLGRPAQPMPDEGFRSRLGGANVMDPNDPKQLAYLDAVAKTLTAEAEASMRANENTRELALTIERFAATAGRAQKHLDDAARHRLSGRTGLMGDEIIRQAEIRSSLNPSNLDPFQQAEKTFEEQRRDLQFKQGQMPGVDFSAEWTKINAEFQTSVATATAALGTVATGSDKASAALLGLAPATDAVTRAFSSFGGQSYDPESLRSARANQGSGVGIMGWGIGTPRESNLGVPGGGALTLSPLSGPSIGFGDININGNVDSEARVRQLTSQIVEQVMRRLNQQTKSARSG